MCTTGESGVEERLSTRSGRKGENLEEERKSRMMDKQGERDENRSGGEEGERKERWR